MEPSDVTKGMLEQLGLTEGVDPIEIGENYIAVTAPSAHMPYSMDVAQSHLGIGIVADPSADDTNSMVTIPWVVLVGEMRDPQQNRMTEDGKVNVVALMLNRESAYQLINSTLLLMLSAETTDEIMSVIAHADHMTPLEETGFSKMVAGTTSKLREQADDDS